MFIRSLHLHHIRSYDDATIDFLPGTTLLTGDIGSGKTSVLLALEFALFGILRGKTSPQEFLAHDAKEGGVTLHCELQGKQVRITRGLKRGSNGITQTPGELTVNGEKETLVATELKARVLTLLGYPESLLAKSVNLFRYTVYTPQEQVKTILFESSDERKDVVRKIFALDTYKIVQDNITHYTASLRERIQRLKGQTDDVKTLKEQLASYEKRADAFTQQIPQLEQAVKIATEAYTKAKESIEQIRKEQEQKQQALAKIKLTKQAIASAEELLEHYQHRATQLKKQLATYKEKKIVVAGQQEEKIKQALHAIDQKKALLHRRYGELASSDTQANKLAHDITSLTVCPVCKQDVGTDHKAHIQQEQEKILSANNTRREKLNALEKSILQKEQEILAKQEVLRKQQQEQALAAQQQREQQKAEQELTTVHTHIAKQEELIKEKKTLLQALEKHLAQQKDITAEQEQKQLAKTESVLREKTNTLQERKGQAKIIDEQITIHKRAIKEKQAIEKEITTLHTIKTWIGDLFIPLLNTMEKKLLLKVYQEFNAYFVKWFDQLLADESLSVKLDEDFTPLVTQHGYDTHLSNLSGGEKTSVALAYRLALNKVLNDYFSFIHTKGLLILDEPTDGFSAEQLDRLRDVLSDANVAQLIIVSHEQKLESLAEHIVRIEKTSQHSQIMAF